MKQLGYFLVGLVAVILSPIYLAAFVLVYFFRMCIEPIKDITSIGKDIVSAFISEESE